MDNLPLSITHLCLPLILQISTELRSWNKLKFQSHFPNLQELVFLINQQCTPESLTPVEVLDLSFIQFSYGFNDVVKWSDRVIKNEDPYQYLRTILKKKMKF